MSARVVVRWTPEARALVLSLYRDPQHSGSTIAAILAAEHGLAVTASAVIGVAYRGEVAAPRVRLTREESRIRSRDRKREKRAAARAGRPAPERKPRPAAPPRVRIPKPPKPAAFKAVPVPRPAPIPRPPPARVLPSLGIPLIAARDGQCRFIADDPRDGPATVCGHPCASGSPWCAGHRRVCTVPTRPAWVPERKAA